MMPHTSQHLSMMGNEQWRCISRTNTTEKTLFLEKIERPTLLLKFCVMSSYFKLTISVCSVASIDPIHSMVYVLKKLYQIEKWRVYNGHGPKLMTANRPATFSSANKQNKGSGWNPIDQWGLLVSDQSWWRSLLLPW